MNRQQKRNQGKQAKAKAVSYNPAAISKLSMQQELHEKLSLSTLITLEKEMEKMMENAAREATIPVAERVHKMGWAVVFRALIDQFGFGKKRLMRLFELCNDYMNDIESGLLDIDDMCKTLLNEDGINIQFKMSAERIKENDDAGTQ